jgi:MFS superfamily sulfate permease-like transporter
LNKIPYASLAAILLVTGYNLTKPQLYRNMWSLGRKQFIPFMITVVVILSTDLLLGVCIGLLISVYYIVQSNFKIDYKITQTRLLGIETQYIKLNHNVTFLNKVKLRKTLDEVPEYSILTIDGTESRLIDYDILEIISEFQSKAHNKHIELHLINIEKVSVMAVH